jgi:(2R)-ethylmalonyl-CoA mutase
VLSGSHVELAAQIMAGLKAEGADQSIQVVVGGIIPVADLAKLQALGVAKVFTPSDYDLLDIMEAIVSLLEEQR